MASQRIMLIDNEVGLCRMMEAVLKDQGYQVKSYTHPVQAVAEFSAGDYDLIITGSQSGAGHFLGSVANAIVRFAEQSVLIVRTRTG